MTEFNAIDELGKGGRMEPLRSRKMLLVDPEKYAALQAEVERLRNVAKAAQAVVGKVARNEIDQIHLIPPARMLCLALIEYDEWRAELEPQP